MKNKLSIIGSLILGFASQVAIAQAPAGSTGQCKDGTYTNAPKKAGACSGHKGVQSWFAAGSSAPAAAAPAAQSAPAKSAAPAMSQSKPAPAAQSAPAKSTAPAVSQSKPAPPAMTPAPTPAPARPSPAAASMPSQAPAAGGGPGMVWVNISTKVYHCAGTRYYGTTKNGKYMTEAEATSMGAHPDHGKACTKG